jgi:acyl dehydratase
VSERLPRITPELLARERERVGRPIGRLQPHVETATKDAIRHWARGIGDRNELWTDEARARTAGWGGQIAPPTLVLAMDRNIVRAVGFRGIHGWHLRTSLEFSDVIRRDQSLVGASVVESIQDVQSSYAGGVAHDQTIRTDLSDGATGAPVCLARTLIRRFEREAGKQTARYQRSRQVYDADELARIAQAYADEKIRGAETLTIEQVRVGEPLPRIIRGPLTIMDCIAFVIAWGGAYVFAHGYAWDFVREHPGVFPVNDSNVPDSPERTHWSDEFARAIGAPAAFDYGPQRIAWCGTLVTNWMGDAGRLRRLTVQLLRPNYHGDTVYLDGVVSEVSVEERIATVTFSGRNQLDEVVVDGSAEVVLPAR